jgi:Glyoxalase/Bleomycin resistance protein/Dioxygenase superfamily
MPACAVIYVGDLDRMRTFYARCFGLTVADAAEGYCGLKSEAWLLTLIQSAQAVAESAPRAGASTPRSSSPSRSAALPQSGNSRPGWAGTSIPALASGSFRTLAVAMALIPKATFFSSSRITPSHRPCGRLAIERKLAREHDDPGGEREPRAPAAHELSGMIRANLVPDGTEVGRSLTSRLFEAVGTAVLCFRTSRPAEATWSGARTGQGARGVGRLRWRGVSWASRPGAQARRGGPSTGSGAAAWVG